MSTVTTVSKFLLLITYTIICKLYVFDIYQVNSSSMEGTLMKGDVLFINKLAYGPQEINSVDNISWVKLFHKNPGEEQICLATNRKPGYTNIRRNDVFIYELFPGYFVVKRCIGMPGEVLSIRNDTALVNNRIVDFPADNLSQYHIQFADAASMKKYLSTISRSVIDSVNIEEKVLVANLSPGSLPQKAWQVMRLPNKLLIGKTPYFLPGEWTINRLGPLTVPYRGWAASHDALYRSTIAHWECSGKSAGHVFKDNYYFMMGDNKPYSEDSRYLGFIPEKKIVGKVAFILFSYNEKGFVWNRLFKNIL
ncbi:signal peptidase I [Chitinophaga rhizophila]|uniref:Signal peptidase I n=1 Tax=Chitinophaga rhizophila TaxID=2866212 RepID=A0ABS7GAY8_9BACT|nr:signal peptidase I [Chitinophaga rhizophila]MBW8683882.1 signal peptidase I [Chitinophaga rhizophila]